MVQQIVDQFDPLRVVLFGSRARGDDREDSDVDLLVVVRDPLTARERRELTIAMRVAVRGSGLPKDILVTTPAGIEASRAQAATVIGPALREGVVLYTRE